MRQADGGLLDVCPRENMDQMMPAKRFPAGCTYRMCILHPASSRKAPCVQIARTHLVYATPTSWVTERARKLEWRSNDLAKLVGQGSQRSATRNRCCLCLVVNRRSLGRSFTWGTHCRDLSRHTRSLHHPPSILALHIPNFRRRPRQVACLPKYSISLLVVYSCTASKTKQRCWLPAICCMAACCWLLLLRTPSSRPAPRRSGSRFAIELAWRHRVIHLWRHFYSEVVREAETLLSQLLFYLYLHITESIQVRSVISTGKFNSYSTNN